MHDNDNTHATSTVDRSVVEYRSIGFAWMPVERPLPRRLLGIWAHPDDECYLSAGLMARVVAPGGAVRIVCATRGEYGTGEPALAGTTAFAAERQAELEASLGALGVTDVEFLGLADGSCDAADDCEMAARIAAEIGRFDADTVVTFGPDGITGHADHRAVNRWTTAAIEDAHPGVELLYACVTVDQAARHRTMHDSIGLFADLPGGRAAAVGMDEVALRCSLDDAELGRKRRALACHGSQTDALAELIGEETYLGWWRDECFRRPTLAERADAAFIVGLHAAAAPPAELVGAPS